MFIGVAEFLFVVPGFEVIGEHEAHFEVEVGALFGDGGLVVGGSAEGGDGFCGMDFFADFEFGFDIA